MIIHLVAEGRMEEAVAARLLRFCGHTSGNVYGMRGSDYIRQKAVAFRHLATESSGVLVLTDFRDSKAVCVPAALEEYVWNRAPVPPRTFLCRFAVNEMESWLLADRGGLAKFLGIAVSKIPLQPENEMFPKTTLVNLARASRKRKICEDIAPPPGHHAAVGPGYMDRIREFIANHWNIDAAMCCAPSLASCVHRLRELPKS